MKNEANSSPDDGVKTRIRRRITVSVIMAFYLLFIVVMILLYRHELLVYISEPERFREWIDSFGFAGRLIYILIVALQVVLAVIHDGLDMYLSILQD